MAVWLEPYFNTVEISRLCDYIILQNTAEIEDECVHLFKGDVAGLPIMIFIEKNQQTRLNICGRGWVVITTIEEENFSQGWQAANDNGCGWPPVQLLEKWWNLIDVPKTIGNQERFEKDLVILRLFSDLWLDINP